MSEYVTPSTIGLDDCLKTMEELEATIAYLETERGKFRDLKSTLGDILWPNSGAEWAFREDTHNIIQKVRELMQATTIPLEDIAPLNGTNEAREYRSNLLQAHDELASLKQKMECTTTCPSCHAEFLPKFNVKETK